MPENISGSIVVERISAVVPFETKVWFAHYCRLNRTNMSDVLGNLLAEFRASVEASAAVEAQATLEALNRGPDGNPPAQPVIEEQGQA